MHSCSKLIRPILSIHLQLPHVHTIIVIEEPWKGEVELLDAKYQGKKSLYTWKSVYISGRENANIEPTPPNSEDIAILMYTSGSTGNPKVRFPSGHRNLMKTYHNEANTPLITKGALKTFLDFFRQSA